MSDVPSRCPGDISNFINQGTTDINSSSFGTSPPQLGSLFQQPACAKEPKESAAWTGPETLAAASRPGRRVPLDEGEEILQESQPGPGVVFAIFLLFLTSWVRRRFSCRSVGKEGGTAEGKGGNVWVAGGGSWRGETKGTQVRLGEMHRHGGRGPDASRLPYSSGPIRSEGEDRAAERESSCRRSSY